MEISWNFVNPKSGNPEFTVICMRPDGICWRSRPSVPQCPDQGQLKVKVVSLRPLPPYIILCSLRANTSVKNTSYEQHIAFQKYKWEIDVAFVFNFTQCKCTLRSNQTERKWKRKRNKRTSLLRCCSVHMCLNVLGTFCESDVAVGQCKHNLAVVCHPRKVIVISQSLVGCPTSNWPTFNKNPGTSPNLSN